MSDPTRLSRRYSSLVVACLSLLVLSCVAFLVPAPYVTLKPGAVFNTLGDFDGKPTIEFGQGVKTYKTNGVLDFTTVSVTRADARVSFGDLVVDYFKSDVAVVPKALVYPDDESAKESTAESAAQLDSSKDASRVAALRAAGYTVPSQVTVAGVVKGGASVGRLEPKDVVTAVDGTRVATPADAVTAVGRHRAGETVRLTVRRDGTRQDVSIVTKPDAKDPKAPRIGVTLGTTFDYPIKVDNNVGRRIGGPSAGTMFGLAIYDKLTPGSLTGGRHIAGTGEITPDGLVGSIGGIRQKMAGAAKAGATIFLVPAANCSEATDGDDHGLRLVKISTLTGAISALEALAKDPEAQVPACS